MSAPAPPDSRAESRARSKTALKAAATLGILAIVLYKVPFSELAARLGKLRLFDVLALVALTIAQVSFGVVRWFRLLRRLGERPRFFALYGDVLVGLTYNMFLPTTVGGDVIRALRARKRVSAAHRAWSTSLFERIAGLLAMAASGAIAATIGLGGGLGGGLGVGGENRVPPALQWIAGGATLVLLLIFFFASAPFRVLVRMLERRLPGAADDVRGIVEDLEGPLATPGARAEALAWSILVQALGIAFVVVGARGLDAPGHDAAILVGVPLVHVLSMVPITIGGLGLREGLFVGILGMLRVPADVALGLAAQWLASSVAFAIAGAGVAVADPAPSVHGDARRGQARP
ncbi:MAG: flippase-like domain-containing protein [Deltaproteobacteria bacterium]|nr:flippase-like domain-containing protein [Deltaproteobacteria bacterium]